MSDETDARLFYPHVVRNRDAILEVLRRVLPPRGLVLELASGSGEHAVYFAERLNEICWRPTDADARALASVAAHRACAKLPNLLEPLRLDVTAAPWSVARADAVVCINMIHISPWAACEEAMAGARRALSAGGILYFYGPFKMDGRHTAPSNSEFDRSLRARNPQWGVRDLGEVVSLAQKYDFALRETVEMPANNLSVVFAREEGP